MRILAVGGGRGLDQIIDAIGPRDEFIKGHSSFGRSPYNPKSNEIFGVLDDKVTREPYKGVVSSYAALRMFTNKEFDAAIISVSTSIDFRERIFNDFTEAGIPFTNIIHSTAHVAANAELGIGNVILAHCHIGSHAKIGDNNFISAKCSIEHHNELGRHNTFGPGVMTSSRVKIGSKNRFGTGIFIEPGVFIANECLIGSGTVLTGNRVIKSGGVIKTAFVNVEEING